MNAFNQTKQQVSAGNVQSLEPGDRYAVIKLGELTQTASRPQDGDERIGRRLLQLLREAGYEVVRREA